MPTLRSLSQSLGLALLILDAAAIAQVPLALTALSAGPRTPFPNATDNSFESTVGTNRIQYGSWASWVMTGNSGIAHQGHAWVAPLWAPDGSRVAFLQGSSAIAASFQPAVGNCRVHFRGAQRQNATSHQVVQVWIGPTLVFEGELPAAGFKEYTTRTVYIATPPPPTTVTILGTSTGPNDIGLVDLIELEPVADWQAASSWSPAQVPGLGNSVVIPSDVEVAIRGTATADSVEVNGELVTAFEDADLKANWVSVSGSTAKLEVGQERTPFAQNFNLTLLGQVPVVHSQHAGTKFLMAMDGGTIDMHGTDKTSWTKLTSLVPVGLGTDIQVPEHEGWQVGDELVVAFTGHVSHVAGLPACGGVYAGPRSRRGNITAIDPITDVVTIDIALPPAEHCTATPIHYGPPSPLGWDLDQRAEVGVLTRNVLICGDAAPNGFGGHVMIMDCCPMMPPGLGRFSNIELSNMGQKQMLGRYPMHWHMVRDVRPGNYVRNSSVHDSNNRAITVHGSHNVVVERNVCVDIMGHAVFLEDGVEHGNQFLDNLVLRIHKPAQCEQMLPHDNSLDEAQNRTPAAFWISNPANVFVGNVAADSLGVGYWFALHRSPTGLSSTGLWYTQFLEPSGHLVNASRTDLGTFADNVAHSIKMGVDVHDSVQDAVGARHLPTCMTPPPTLTYCSGSAPMPPTTSDPTDDDILTNWQWQPPNEAVLERFLAYGCTTGLYSGGGILYVTKIRFDDAVLADNGVHVQFASADTVSNSVLVYDSGNLIFPTPFNGLPNGHLHPFESGNAYVVYDGPGQLDHCHLVGYDTTAHGNLVFSKFGAARRHTNHRFEGLTFEGTGLPAIEFHDFASEPATEPLGNSGVWGIAIRDIDACLTGGSIPTNPYSPFWPVPTPHTLITNHPMMHLVNGTATTDIQSPYLPATSQAWLSPFAWAHLQVRYYAPISQYDSQTGLYPGYDLLQLEFIPPAVFKRNSYQGFPSSSLPDTVLPGGQLRQLPIIVRPGASTAPECTYEVEVTEWPGASPHGRVDISVDDAAAGDVTRLLITNAARPNWNPALRINDDPTQIHINGQHPNGLPMVPNAPPGPSTTYQLTTLGSATAIDLHMVNPNRTHRITITW